MTHTSARVWQWVGIILILGLFGGAYWYFEVKAGLKTNTGSTQPQGTGSLASGLAGYWPLDNGSGTSATDASTNGNTGTLTNGPTWTTGQIGSAVDFDGVDDYITMGDLNLLDGLSQMTVSVWIQPDTSGLIDYEGIVRKGTSDTNRFAMARGGTSTGGNNDVDVMVGDGSNAYGYTNTDILASGQWMLLTMVFDGVQSGNSERLKLYKDGNLQSLTFSGTIPASTPSTNTGSLQVGFESASRYFGGNIDEVRIYNRALLADEIAQLYRLTSPTGVDTSLKGYWSFNGQDMNGTTAYDRSGAGNNGTLTNGPVAGKGKVGQALSFDGTDDYTVAADANSLDITGAISLSTWVKTTDTDGCILSKSNSTPDGCFSSPGTKVYELGILSSTLWFQIGNGTSAATVSGSASSILDNNWHYITATWDGTTGTNGLKLYIDGVLTYQATSAVSTIQSVSTEFLFAGKNGPYDYAGLIDETRLYNRALSATEIKGLYDVGESDKVNSSVSQAQGTGRLDSGLAGYWKMDDGSGTSATDASTNGNTAYFINTPTWTTGQIGGALDFTDPLENQSLSVADVFDMPDGANFSIAGWFYRSTFNTVDIIIANTAGLGAIYTGYGIYIDGTSDALVLLGADGTDMYTLTSSSTFTGTGWNHFVAVWNDTSANETKLYINGKLENSTASGTFANVGGMSNVDLFHIGSESDIYTSNERSFRGRLDEIRVYNRTLSADEVAQLYRLNTPTGVDTSLKGYWSFNAPDMASTTAYDRSGVGNTGTLTNSPTKASGIVGQAVDFDGTNDYVSLTDGAQFDPGGTASWCLWFYNDTALASSTALFMHDAASARSASTYKWIAAYLTSNSTNLSTYVRIGGTAYNAVGPTLATGYYTNAWHHVCSTFDKSLSSARLKIYIDGTLSGTADATNGDIDAGGFPEIGRWEQGSGYFNGKIDEVRMYNRALTAGEIKSQYDAATPDKGNSSVSQPQGTGRLDSGLAGYWKLDDGSGNNAVDASTNGKNLGASGTALWTTGFIGGAGLFNATYALRTSIDEAIYDIPDGTNFTLSGWFNRSAFAGDDFIIAKRAGIAAGNVGYALYVDDATDKLTFEVSDGTDEYQLESVSTFTVAGWHYFTVVWNDASATETRLSIDGVAEAATATGTFGNVNSLENSEFFYVGATSTLALLWDGSLDEIRVYNRTLSADEVSQLYRLATPTGTDTSLKGYWSFNGQDISGTTAYDRSGVGNNGTLTNSPTKTIGKIGQALSFDGSNDYVITGVATPYQFANTTFTVTGWFKKTGTLTEALVSQGGCNGGWVIFLASGTLQPVIKGTGACGTQPASRSSSTTTLNDGTWHHFAAVMTTNTTTPASNTLSIYIDGALNQGSLSQDGTSYVTSAINLQMGARNGGSDNPLTGSLDEVRIYSRALSASEITALYNSSR